MESEARAGTERYMAPEQVLGEVHRIDGRTDLWAIGVMYYEMLTGSSPFRAKDRQALFDKILSDDPLPVRQKRPELPPIVDHVCCKCMSKSMADRYQSAMDLIEDLSRFRMSLSQACTYRLGRKSFLNR